jgi:signal transduction histidine kinase
LYADDRLTLAASRRGRTAAAAAGAEPRRQGSTYKVARTGEMILIPDVPADPNYPGDPKGWPGALACVPLKLGLRVVGVLNAAYEEPHAFGQEETRLLLLLADQAAIAIENARLYGMAQQELLERRRAEQALQKANEGLERKVAGRTHALLEATSGWRRQGDRPGDLAAAHGGNRRRGSRVYEPFRDMPISAVDMAGVAAGVDGPHSGFKWDGRSLEDYGPIDDLQAGEVRRVDDLSVLPVLTPLRSQLLEAGILSFLTVPLVADGELIGEINLDSSRRSAFDMDAELLGREVGYQLAVALRQAVLRVALETSSSGWETGGEPAAGVALLDGTSARPGEPVGLREYLPERRAGFDRHAAKSAADLGTSAGHRSQQGEVRLEAGLKLFGAPLRGKRRDGRWIVQIRCHHRAIGPGAAAVAERLAAGAAGRRPGARLQQHHVGHHPAAEMLSGPGRSVQDVERLRTITQQGQRAAQLIQQILDFSRKSVMEQHPFDLVPFLREMEGLLTRTLPETIRVRVVTEGESFMLYGDPARIRQVCINLALNAREAMPDGGDLRFTLSLFQLREGEAPPSVDMEPGEWIRMTVTDSGPGIKPDVMPHIFEPFFTTKSPAQASGLGLAQVYGIVQQHHGHIDVVSPKDGGTIFSLYWPAHAAAVAPVVPAEDDDAGRGSGETILVVEDNEATRDSVSEILTALGYRVLQASDGRQALEVHDREAGRIDLVLSDLVMPGMGSTNWCELSRRRHRATHPADDRLPAGARVVQSPAPCTGKPLTMTKLARAVEALGNGPAQGCTLAQP